MEKQQSTKTDKVIERQELLSLYAHYESVIKDELDLFFKYFNFYIGLFSALLAGTITGLLSIKESSHKVVEYILLLGPVLIIIMTFIAYYFIRVYYRRFLEALVTAINIKAMLGYNKVSIFANDILAPLFPSQYGGGFITQFNRVETRQILTEGIANGWPAEQVLDKLLAKGDTIRYARLTLGAYFLASVILLFVVTYRVCC